MANFFHRQMLVACALSSAALQLPATAIAQQAEDSFPSRPIRLVVPTQGGTVDLIARTVGPRLSEAMGQPVVIETKAGASGNIAAAMVASSPDGGYTLLAGYNPLAISSFLRTNLNYELKDLKPVTLAVSSEQILVVHPDVEATNLQEFISLAKQKQGALNYASISPGSASHLTMELFKKRAGIDMRHIPYKGAAPALTDLLGKTTDAGVFAAANVIPFVKEGRLRALAVTGNRRLTSLPNVPSMAEVGFPDFNATIWIGFLVNAKTPDTIVRRYNDEIAKVLQQPEVQASITKAEFQVIGNSPEEFKTFIESEITTWGDIAKQVGSELN